MSNTSSVPRFIYLTGCDGVGKSTEAARLIAYLRQCGLRVKRLWLRFPFFLSIPLLIYARAGHFSWREKKNGYQYGYWEFWRSPLLRRLFPWTLLLDAALAAIWRIYFPLLLGQVIVCERFVMDMLVDLMVACRDFSLPGRLPGKLYLKLIPPSARLILLDVDCATIIARRPELREDRSLEARRDAFQTLAMQLGCPVLLNDQAIEALHRQVLILLGLKPE